MQPFQKQENKPYKYMCIVRLSVAFVPVRFMMRSRQTLIRVKQMRLRVLKKQNNGTLCILYGGSLPPLHGENHDKTTKLKIRWFKQTCVTERTNSNFAHICYGCQSFGFVSKRVHGSLLLHLFCLPIVLTSAYALDFVSFMNPYIFFH